MNLNLSKVEHEMLKILRLRDQRYRRGLEQKINEELQVDYEKLKKLIKSYLTRIINRQIHSVHWI